MTDKQWEAGRELDIEILKRVFGVKEKSIRFEEWDTENRGPTYIPSGKPWRTHAIDARPVPRFSTSWDAAGQLIGKMGEKYHWKITSPFTEGELWFGGLTSKAFTGWNGRSDIEAQGSTFPLAVCRAALMAVNTKSP